MNAIVTYEQGMIGSPGMSNRKHIGIAIIKQLQKTSGERDMSGAAARTGNAMIKVDKKI